MTKTELINVVAEKTGFSKKDSDKAVAAVIDAISETLAGGDKVQLVGFGTFEVKERGERKVLIQEPKKKSPLRLPNCLLLKLVKR